MRHLDPYGNETLGPEFLRRGGTQDRDEYHGIPSRETVAAAPVSPEEAEAEGELPLSVNTWPQFIEKHFGWALPARGRPEAALGLPWYITLLILFTLFVFGRRYWIDGCVSFACLVQQLLFLAVVYSLVAVLVILGKLFAKR